MIGVLVDLLYMECYVFCLLGVMGIDIYVECFEVVCCLFDWYMDGFIFGEVCGVIVLECVEFVE